MNRAVYPATCSREESTLRVATGLCTVSRRGAVLCHGRGGRAAWNCTAVGAAAGIRSAGRHAAQPSPCKAVRLDEQTRALICTLMLRRTSSCAFPPNLFPLSRRGNRSLKRRAARHVRKVMTPLRVRTRAMAVAAGRCRLCSTRRATRRSRAPRAASDGLVSERRHGRRRTPHRGVDSRSNALIRRFPRVRPAQPHRARLSPATLGVNAPACSRRVPQGPS
jgi:hypothetical protein